MNNKIIYKSHNLSVVRLLQGMAVLFLVVGMVLAFKLAAAPVTSVTSHTTHQGWAVALGVIAAFTPVLAWLYGRRVGASIAISQDGQFVHIKSASIVEQQAKQWPTTAVVASSLKKGDAKGETEFGLPRITLTLDSGNQRRNYTLSFKSREQLDVLRAALQGRAPTTL